MFQKTLYLIQACHLEDHLQTEKNEKLSLKETYRKPKCCYHEL